MTLLQQYLIEERSEIMEQNIRFTTIGRPASLPDACCAKSTRPSAFSQDNTGMALCLAINYGGRTELVDAVRRRRRAGRAGLLDAGRDRRGGRSATPSTPRACPIRTCSFARPARCASAISSSGRSPMRSCGSRKDAGPTSIGDAAPGAARLCRPRTPLRRP